MAAGCPALSSGSRAASPLRPGISVRDERLVGGVTTGRNRELPASFLAVATAEAAAAAAETAAARSASISWASASALLLLAAATAATVAAAAETAAARSASFSRASASALLHEIQGSWSAVLLSSVKVAGKE